MRICMLANVLAFQVRSMPLIRLNRNMTLSQSNSTQKRSIVKRARLRVDVGVVADLDWVVH